MEHVVTCLDFRDSTLFSHNEAEKVLLEHLDCSSAAELQGAGQHSAATPRSHGANRTNCPLVELLHPVLRVVLTARL